MRASRLVSFLLVLQTRGHLTALELADRLAVSERTVQRDARELAEAGVPIVSVRGPAGGYRLERGYRTKLTGLDASEAEALFVGPAAELGLGRELSAARLKLLASLPAELQERAGRAAQLFHVDKRGWFREEDRVPHLPAIAGALWRGRRLDIRYREGAAVVSRRLDPRVVEDGERPTVIAQFDGLAHAFHTLLAYGADAEVLAPRELRERIAAAA